MEGPPRNETASLPAITQPRNCALSKIFKTWKVQRLILQSKSAPFKRM